MAASTLYAAEYDLVFYPDADINNKEYSLTYTVPDVPDTIESTIFDDVQAFNESPNEVVKNNWTYPATDIPADDGSYPVFSHIKEARFIETIRTPIE